MTIKKPKFIENPSPHLAMVKIDSPLLELIMNEQNDMVTTSLTPFRLHIFPINVTEEQENLLADLQMLLMNCIIGILLKEVTSMIL